MTTNSVSTESQAHTKRYRVDFALILLAGNATRYQITRPIVERDPSILARWYPIRTWFESDPLRFLPGKLRLRLRHALDTWKLYILPPADAIVIHAFETYYLYVLWQRLLRSRVVIVKNSDGGLYRPQPGDRFNLWKWSRTLERTDRFVLWTDFGCKMLKDNFPEIPDEKIIALHPGLNLEEWPMRAPVTPGPRFRLLFVGGDLLRKGADTLLDAFDQYLSETCELHIATQTSWLEWYSDFHKRLEATPRVTLYKDLTAGSPELKRLFSTCDAFIMPTNNDQTPWVAIEALATGIPIIITPEGAIPEIVLDEETGILIPHRCPEAIAEAVNRLRASPELGVQFARRGRAHVEKNFDANKNTERLTCLIKQLVDARRATSQKRKER